MNFERILEKVMRQKTMVEIENAKLKKQVSELRKKKQTPEKEGSKSDPNVFVREKDSSGEVDHLKLLKEKLIHMEKDHQKEILVLKNQLGIVYGKAKAIKMKRKALSRRFDVLLRLVQAIHSSSSLKDIHTLSNFSNIAGMMLYVKANPLGRPIRDKLSKMEAAFKEKFAIHKKGKYVLEEKDFRVIVQKIDSGWRKGMENGFLLDGKGKIYANHRVKVETFLEKNMKNLFLTCKQISKIIKTARQTVDYNEGRRFFNCLKDRAIDYNFSMIGRLKLAREISRPLFNDMEKKYGFKAFFQANCGLFVPHICCFISDSQTGSTKQNEESKSSPHESESFLSKAELMKKKRGKKRDSSDESDALICAKALKENKKLRIQIGMMEHEAKKSANLKEKLLVVYSRAKSIKLKRKALSRRFDILLRITQAIGCAPTVKDVRKLTDLYTVMYKTENGLHAGVKINFEKSLGAHKSGKGEDVLDEKAFRVFVKKIDFGWRQKYQSMMPRDDVVPYFIQEQTGGNKFLTCKQFVQLLNAAQRVSTPEKLRFFAAFKKKIIDYRYSVIGRYKIARELDYDEFGWMERNYKSEQFFKKNMHLFRTHDWDAVSKM